MNEDPTEYLSIAELVKEFYDSEHYKQYTAMQFNHLQSGYDVMDSMNDYFKNKNLVAIHMPKAKIYCEHNSTSAWGRLVTCMVCGHEWIKD